MTTTRTGPRQGARGGTIADGFLLLSLPADFHGQAVFPTLATDDEYVINDGLDRVRFIDPVRVGDLIEARMWIADITVKKDSRGWSARPRPTYRAARDRPTWSTTCPTVRRRRGLLSCPLTGHPAGGGRDVLASLEASLASVLAP